MSISNHKLIATIIREVCQYDDIAKIAQKGGGILIRTEIGFLIEIHKGLGTSRADESDPELIIFISPLPDRSEQGEILRLSEFRNV